MGNALRRDRLPDRRVVVRLDFTGFRPHERYWLLLEHGEAEICKTYPGLDEDLYITADAEAFVKWHAGQLSWAEATRDARIQLHGPSWLVRAFPSWNGRSMFAHVRPAAPFGVMSPKAAPLSARLPRETISRRMHVDIRPMDETAIPVWLDRARVAYVADLVASGIGEDAAARTAAEQQAAAFRRPTGERSRPVRCRRRRRRGRLTLDRAPRRRRR